MTKQLEKKKQESSILDKESIKKAKNKIKSTQSTCLYTNLSNQMEVDLARSDKWVIRKEKST